MSSKDDEYDYLFKGMNYQKIFGVFMYEFVYITVFFVTNTKLTCQQSKGQV